MAERVWFGTMMKKVDGLMHAVMASDTLRHKCCATLLDFHTSHTSSQRTGRFLDNMVNIHRLMCSLLFYSRSQYSFSKILSNVWCVGSEQRLAECEINLVNSSDSNCTRLSLVGCGE